MSLTIAPERLSSLLLLAYQAAEQPEAWPQFLTALRDVALADHADVVLHDLKTGRAIPITTPRDPSDIASYAAHYAARNPWMPTEWDLDVIPQDTIQSGESKVPLSKLRRTEFYADWGKRNDVVFTWSASLSIRDERFLFLSLDRGERRGPFADSIEELLRLVTPHVKRALRLQDLVGRGQAYRTTLDHLSVAVFLVDAQGRVLDMTERARRMVEARDGLRLGRGSVLRTESTGSNNPIAGAIKRVSERLVPRATALRAARSSGKRDHVVVVTRVGEGELPVLPERFEIIVMEPQVTFAAGIDMACRLYGLSKAETRLVQALVATGSLNEAMARLKITRNTARTHLASVFGKTHTSGQPELIRVLGEYARLTHLGED